MQQKFKENVYFPFCGQNQLVIARLRQVVGGKPAAHVPNMAPAAHGPNMARVNN